MSDAPNKQGLSVTLWICAIVMVLGLVVTLNYMFFYKRQLGNQDYLPNIQALEKDLQLLTPEGEEVSFHELQGKVWVLGYIFTRCPSGCLGVVAKMKELYEEFGADPNFHMVALSLDPEKDTPEWLEKWTQENGLSGENWWFLTGDRRSIHSYMSRYFKLHVSKVTDPDQARIYGDWEHEFKLVLVDHKLMIRYYYDITHFERGEEQFDKLRRDIKRLLKEAEKAEVASATVGAPKP